MLTSPQEQRIIDALEPEAHAHGIDIVDVSIVGSKGAPIVDIRIDHADEATPTITLDEISAQSDWINTVIDALDPFPSSYTLEISSPGMERPLRTPHDFERFAGKQVAIQTTNTEGRRRWSGTLKGFVDEHVVIVSDEGEKSFTLEELKSCTIKPDFDAHKGKKDSNTKKNKKK